jgi:hypothetical protein
MTRKVKGKYFGTEINQKWWNRYMKNKMLARGNGTFSYNDNAISFLRLLTKVPIVIEFDKILDLKIGKWHAGQWGKGRPIIKILWKNNGRLLSSGFSISAEPEEFETVLSELRNALEPKDKNSI